MRPKELLAKPARPLSMLSVNARPGSSCSDSHEPFGPLQFHNTFGVQILASMR